MTPYNKIFAPKFVRGKKFAGEPALGNVIALKRNGAYPAYIQVPQLGSKLDV